MTLETGQVLQNRYRIVSPLKRGGMGAIYRAWDTRLNVPIALKEMIAQPDLDARTLAQLRRQFQQEAMILARLDHPHMVGVTDFFEEQGNAYLVMKLIEGENLAERIERQGALPEAHVLAWADQLLDALAYCHSQGVLHRDIKPHNVIVQPDGRAILVDFGLVKLWDPHDPRTRTAIRAMGTPEYAPPEQYDDAGIGHTDPRSDVYSLGATLYHTLVGKAPPTATRRIVDPTALTPVRILNPQVRPHLEMALMKAMDLSPDARFRSAAELRMALQGTIPITPPHRRAADPPSVRRKAIPWGWIGLAAGVTIIAVILLGGAILGGAWLLDNRQTSSSSTGQTVTATAQVDNLASEAILAATAAVPSPTLAPPPQASTSTPIPPTEPPTSTPILPTEPPTSTPVPTQTPTPVCPAVTGLFADLWQTVQERLGCAANQPHTTWMAEETFEHGRMFWREDTDMLSVIYNNGNWASYQDIWNEGDPDYSCPDSAPQESPPAPMRGFGKIWCAYSPVRDGLGWATDIERGDYATAQDFENGSIIRTNAGATYILYADGGWERR